MNVLNVPDSSTVTARSWDEVRPRTVERPVKYAVTLAQSIVREICQRNLPAGTTLPPEREMLLEYQVGRGTLREALRYLELQGVLVLRPGPGGGPRVSEPGSQHLANTLALLLQMKGTPFRDIVQTRLMIEPTLAAEAARHRDDEVVDALQSSVDRSLALIGKPGSEADLWTEVALFHDLIAQAAGNNVLRLYISSLRWTINQVTVGVSYSDRRQRAIGRSQRTIADAIRRRDSAEAAETMRLHLHDWADFLERRYPEVLERTVEWRPGL